MLISLRGRGLAGAGFAMLLVAMPCAAQEGAPVAAPDAAEMGCMTVNSGWKRCLNRWSTRGMLVEVRPKVARVTFTVQVFHSTCDFDGTKRFEGRVTLISDAGTGGRYRFNQALTEVYEPARNTRPNCIEFFLGDCLGADNKPGTCHDLVETIAFRPPGEGL